MQFPEEMLGNPHSNIWILQSNPKRGETTPMSQQNASWFLSYLYGQDVSLADIRFEYIVNGVPLRGDSETFWANGTMDKGIREVKERILTYKPNIVICIGSDVLRAMFNQRDISAWRGHVLMCGDVKCIATYDPVAAHRQKFVGIKQKAGQYEVLMRQDIRKAVEESKYPEARWDEIPTTICTNHAHTIAILKEMYEEAHIISFDIEVIEPYEGRLMDCLSLGDEHRRSLCIPLWRSTGDPKDKKTWGIERVWKTEGEFLEVLHWVKKILESKIPKVAQNSQYDITSLEYYYGIMVNNLSWDTLVAAHTIFCDLPKDLGTLISMYTNIPYHKYLIHSGSIADRWEYSAADAGANLHVMAGQKYEMCDLDGIRGSCKGGFAECLLCTKVYKSPMHRHFRSTILPNIRHIVDMHKEGVRVDEELRKDVLKLEHEYQEAILRALSIAIPIPMGKNTTYHVNPKSPMQVKKLFYDILNCKTMYVKGKAQFNKGVRSTLGKKDKRPYVQVLLRAIDEYIFSDAALLKFKVPLDNGHIRTLYKPEGTDTGRFASTASDVLPAGTNLQNVEKGPQRKSIIPEHEDEEFLHADLYAAEAYLNFLDAGEIDGLKMISGLLPEQEGKFPYEDKFGCRVMTKEVSDGLKIHNWLGRYIADNFEAEAKEAKFKYKNAKQLIHAMNYNVQPPMMSKESGLPLSVCTLIYNMYHTKFPGIQDRMIDIQKKLQSKRFLVSAAGRRRYFFAPINKDLYNVAYAWPNQSTIGEVNNIAMCNARTWSGVDGNPLCKPIMNTHDGLVCRIKKGTRDQCIPLIINAYKTQLTLRGMTIVIPVSIGFGPNFNDNYEEKVYFYE